MTVEGHTEPSLRPSLFLHRLPSLSFSQSRSRQRKLPPRPQGRADASGFEEGRQRVGGESRLGQYGRMDDLFNQLEEETDRIFQEAERMSAFGIQEDPFFREVPRTISRMEPPAFREFDLVERSVTTYESQLGPVDLFFAPFSALFDLMLSVPLLLIPFGVMSVAWGMIALSFLNVFGTLFLGGAFLFGSILLSLVFSVSTAAVSLLAVLGGASIIAGLMKKVFFGDSSSDSMWPGQSPLKRGKRRQASIQRQQRMDMEDEEDGGIEPWIVGEKELMDQWDKELIRRKRRREGRGRSEQRREIDATGDWS